ncbi:hypothetical protein TL16_g08365 [Triparma laevis f. inornata]|uniref:Uncharacterized protein n=1 Tax=Triparma laevis f. inornata TaxID=1714386 RepID=A0A9W7B3W6_9STRA|nr:hypothetical protein TL16_g08365 [Triparma laevis f. inornata]
MAHTVARLRPRLQNCDPFLLNFIKNRKLNVTLLSNWPNYAYIPSVLHKYTEMTNLISLNLREKESANDHAGID